MQTPLVPSKVSTSEASGRRGYIRRRVSELPLAVRIKARKDNQRLKLCVQVLVKCPVGESISCAE